MCNDWMNAKHEVKICEKVLNNLGQLSKTTNTAVKTSSAYQPYLYMYVAYPDEQFCFLVNLPQSKFRQLKRTRTASEI